MSLTIVKLEARSARIMLVGLALACLIAAWFFAKWNLVDAIAERLDPARPETRQIAEWLVETSPGDPHVHQAAAVLYQRTLDPGDLERAIKEFEAAAASSPHNYLTWLNLGKARSLSGDGPEADAAFRRALELAPHYAVVQWAYGNFLLRQGSADEGFDLMAKAAASRSEYATPATIAAMQIYDNDIALVRQKMGNNDVANAALAEVLFQQTRYDESVDAWSLLDPRVEKFKLLGEKLASQLIASHKYGLAARIRAGLTEGQDERPAIGQISNGAFENGIKLRNAGPFEWKIAEGTEPQIGVNDRSPHAGKYSLSMLFNAFQSSDQRSVMQTVAVEPGGAYEFNAFYRSDLKTAASFKWVITEAATGATLAETGAIVPAAEWRELKATFNMPAGSDGVIIQLIRSGCPGPTCPVNGIVSFDDLTLRRL